MGAECSTQQCACDCGRGRGEIEEPASPRFGDEECVKLSTQGLAAISKVSSRPVVESSAAAEVGAQSLEGLDRKLKQEQVRNANRKSAPPRLQHSSEDTDECKLSNCQSGGALLKKAGDARAKNRLHAALQTFDEAQNIRDDSVMIDSATVDSVRKQVKRVDHVLESCSPQTGSGWKHFDLDGNMAAWRRWDPESNALTVVLSWVARGSLLQHVASARDPDADEKLWDGASWDMRSQHSTSGSLCRWLQHDPFTGKKVEIVVERMLCDCLDREKPCYVLVEKSPDVPGIEKFSGKYKSFDIAACPKGYTRAVMAESGRVIEPLSADTCRVSMSLTLNLPAVVRWVVTDSLLCFAGKMGFQSLMKSWNNIVDKWDSSDFVNRIRSNPAFYNPIQERAAKVIASRPESQFLKTGIGA